MKTNLIFRTIPLWMPLLLITCSTTDSGGDGLQLRHNLPSELAENSGMIEMDGFLWFVNDGGNEPVLYSVNQDNGSIERSVYVKNASNTDWEEMTFDADHLYIGDFGNNNGSRTNLRIYILDKSDLSADTVEPSGVIAFAYEDQSDFTPSDLNTPFDCEAFVSVRDSLLLFTKNWVSQHSSVYYLPTTAGNHTAKNMGEHNVEGLVTGAAYSADRNELALSGYIRDAYVPFIRIIPGYLSSKTDLTTGRYESFDDLLGLQTEAIAYTSAGNLIVSAESSPLKPAGFYEFKY